MKNRFYTAMGLYVILGVLAASTLSGNIRLATLVVLAGLALKTYLRHLAEP
jgi:hypothetical protein